MTAPHGQIRTDEPVTGRQDSTSGSRSIARGNSNGDSLPTGVSAPDPDLDEVIDLLGDDYVCDILRALEPGPKPARDLADQCGMSRPTVYRRLDRLTAAGLVESRMSLAQDGHHRLAFHLVFDELQLQVREDGIDGSLRVAAPAGDWRPRSAVITSPLPRLFTCQPRRSDECASSAINSVSDRARDRSIWLRSAPWMVAYGDVAASAPVRRSKTFRSARRMCLLTVGCVIPNDSATSSSLLSPGQSKYPIA